MYGDSVGVTAHEIGHTFGLAHANFWDTAGTSAIGPGANQEYGDSYDNMGGGGVPTDQYNAAAKVQVKWLPQNYVQNVTASGLYRIYAFDQQVLDPRNRYAMTITKDSQRTYWGEVRQLYNGSSSRPWADKGIILGWKYPSESGSNIQLIDTTAGSPYGKDDAAIALGQTFSDTEAGIHMTTVGVSATTPKYVDVLVNMGDFSSNQPPTLSLAASATSVPAGATVTFTATATDPESDTLAYQWQHWGDTSVKIVSPNSPVITRTFPGAGSYVVSCTVSDMKGGSVTKTTLITVGNGNNRFTISGRVTVGGQGLPNVLLSANGTNPTTTDSDGYYTIANLSANTYTVTPALYGYLFSELFNNSITVGPNFTGGNFEAESLPLVSIAAVDASATENNTSATGIFQLTRTGDPSLPLTVNVNPATGTASTGDYTLAPALTAGSGGFSTFTIPADSSTINVVLTTTNDAAAEGPETVRFLLAAGAGYLVAPNQGAATVQIDDDDTTLPKVSLVATTGYTEEGGGVPAEFTVSRTGVTTSSLNVNFSVSGTATSGGDFTSVGTSVTIPAGSSSAPVNITMLQDTLVESMETVTLTVSANAAVYVIDTSAQTGTVSLFDDDTNVVTLSVTDGTSQEIDLAVPGNAPDTGTYLVTRSGDTTSPLTVYYSLAGNPSTGVPALHGVDFEALPGVLTIPAGSSTATITILPRWDGFGETPEQVFLQLGAGPTDYRLGAATSGLVTINDGAAASNPAYAEVAPTTMAIEGGSSGVFMVSVKTSAGGTVSVPFTLTGTATITSDYTVTLPASPAGSSFNTSTGTGTLVITASTTAAATANITIVPVNDTAAEDIENVVCTLTTDPAISLYGPNSTASLWLRDNEQPTVWVDGQIGSGGSVTSRIVEAATTSPFKFYVSRTGSTTAALVVNFAMNGTATPGTDYNVTTSASVTFDNLTRTGTLTIPSGASGADVSLTATGTNDVDVEGTETIIFHLEPGSYGKTPDATLFIDDNDSGGNTVGFDAAGASGIESVTSISIPVSLGVPSAGVTTVAYSVDTGARTSTSATNTVPALPYWTRVVRQGNAFSAFHSTDGTNWKEVGTTQTITMSSASYTVGIIGMSSSSGVSCTATVDNLTITGLDSGVPGATTFGSVGITTPASTSSVASGVYTLNAGGAGLSTSSTSDNGCYVSMPIANSVNSVITARVVSIANGNTTSRAGVTIRESTATGSRHFTCLAEKAGVNRAIYRLATSGNAASATTSAIRPYWTRLTRVGDTFTAYSSVDGSTWAQTTTARVIPMGLDVQAGLAVSARSDGALTTAVFDNVTIDGNPVTGLVGRTIGYVNAQGSDSNVSGTYTVIGSGAQIGGTEDECHFVATTLTGDFDLVARIVSQSGGAANAQAGVMARELHSHRSISAYSGMVANAQHEFISRGTSVTNAFGSGLDFSLANGVLTFNNLEQTKNINLTIHNDTIPEPNESVTVKLHSPTASSLGATTTFTYVIDDDDVASALPFVGFAQTSTSLAEGVAGSQEIFVSLSEPATSAVAVEYALTGGTATHGDDFAFASGTLTFAAGETTKSITLSITDEADDELDETIVLGLSNPVGCTLTSSSAHTFTIVNDDKPVVTIVATDASAAEAGLDPGSFTVSRTGSTTSSLAVTLSRSGTAANSTDYTSISTAATIPVGETSVSIPVTPVNDSTNEGTETVILTISANANYTVGSPSSATVSILDNDRSTITIEALDAVGSETAGNTATFRLTRVDALTTTVSVTLAVSGTATSGSDFTALASPVSFAANETQKILTVTPVNDGLSEGNETVLVTISGSFTIGGAGYAEVVIEDNDYPPVITIETPNANGGLVASGQGIVVSATATDDGQPASLTTVWSQSSGPGTASFDTPSALTSGVTFSQDGVYVLKFSASDSQFTVSDQVTVIVGASINPAGWVAQDMGPTTQQRGQSAQVGGSYVMTGMGAGHAGVTGDSAHIMARQLTGDASITARVPTLVGPATSPSAGVTIRDSLNRSCNRALLAINSAGTLELRARTTVGVADALLASQASIALPIWLKLERNATSGLVTASYATDSSGSPGSWNVLGTATVSMLNPISQTGIVATGNSATAANLCTASFDNVAVTPTPSGAALVSENFGTTPSTEATYAFNGTTYTIAAADGMDSNGAFYGWQYNGDLMVTAKHVDATSGALSAKTGIMIRESMDNTGGYVHLGRITTGSFSGYIWRSVAGGGTGGVPSFTGKVRWMRLVRQGNLITAFHAPDSGGNPGTWVQLGSPRTVIMSPNVLVGFAVDNAGGTAGVLNTAQFSNLSIVPLNKAPNVNVSSSANYAAVNLDGTVTDDDFPTPVNLTTQWSLVAGPGSLVFGNPGLVDTIATAGGSGQFTVRLLADDSSVKTYRDHIFSTWLTPFAQWLDQNNVGNENDPLAEAYLDADGDGMLNLLEYAIGSNGTISQANPQVVSLAASSGEQYLRISIPKNPAATDVTFEVQACSDLVGWTSSGLVVEVDTPTQLVVRDNVPVSSGQQRFMQVKVTR